MGSYSELGERLFKDTFVWRKITFLWSDSKNWDAPAPQLLFPLPMKQ